jgi:hypothetical protein
VLQALNSFFFDTPHICGVGKVGTHRKDPPFAVCPSSHDRLDRLLQPPRVAPNHQHPDAFPKKRTRTGQPDTGTAAGYDRGFSVQVQFHWR